MVQKAYGDSLCILPKGEKFPKPYRFSVGQSLVSSALDLLPHLVDATWQSRNAASLGAAEREVNRSRYLVRLAKDLRILSLDGHEFASNSLDEVGRMAGGWLKNTRIERFEETPSRKTPSA